MAKTSRSKPLKYMDKSAGQPGISDLFEDLKKVLSEYAIGNYFVKSDRPGCYELYYGKKVEVQGKVYPELCFVSLLVQKGYVGFYYFPVYMNTALQNKLGPELRKCLKGKTCFHLKEKDPLLFLQIKEALDLGKDFYVSQGWKHMRPK